MPPPFHEKAGYNLSPRRMRNHPRGTVSCCCHSRKINSDTRKPLRTKNRSAPTHQPVPAICANFRTQEQKTPVSAAHLKPCRCRNANRVTATNRRTSWPRTRLTGFFSTAGTDAIPGISGWGLGNAASRADTQISSRLSARWAEPSAIVGG